MKHLFITVILLSIMISCSEKQSNQDSVTEKSVSFIEPTEGAALKSPIKIKMAIEGMEIEPAGVSVEGKGHHHLIIDGSYVEKGVVVPADERHIHYGAGQTEAEIALSPGPHTLTLQFADSLHVSYGEELSSQITIEILPDSVSLD